jgi:hypothetical protein
VARKLQELMMRFRTERKADDEFVILKGAREENQFDRFFTSLSDDATPDSIIRINDGSVAYEILGYARTIREAQIALYGRAY